MSAIRFDEGMKLVVVVVIDRKGDPVEYCSRAGVESNEPSMAFLSIYLVMMVGGGRALFVPSAG